MRVVQFLSGSSKRVGLLLGDKGDIVDPIALDNVKPFMTVTDRALFGDMVSFVAGGASAIKVASTAIELARKENVGIHSPNEVRLIESMNPKVILCSGGNYTDHVAEKEDAPLKAKEPEFFLKSPTCVIGPRQDIIWDKKTTKKLDYETELAIVIGKSGRHIPVEDALDHVFGYTIVNDVTARDRQVRTENGFTWYETGPGKNFDTSAPIGPCIVTADEIIDPQALVLKTLVNGELRQSNTTGSMIFGVAELVHFFSINFTLEPGFVIITGTPGGTAWAQDKELGGKSPTRDDVIPATGYLQVGDTVDCHIEGIGTLTNTVAELDI
jgi:2-keto-4-pentenoate hydratase/2-oxohepta-3-ene-1,7-dioic acid hydratase in catechol pathway